MSTGSISRPPEEVPMAQLEQSPQVGAPTSLRRARALSRWL
jgi:hypothetical protein